MSDKDYVKLGELLNKLVVQEGTWQSKLETLEAKAEEHDFSDDLREVLEWFE